MTRETSKPTKMLRELDQRFYLWRLDWFPFRTYEYLGWDSELNDYRVGPCQWAYPRRGPFRWFWPKAKRGL